MNELALTGDKQADALCKKLETIREHNDISGSLNFERDILVKAKVDFQLLSPIEFQDLERLFEDRNRCAHPSMVSNEEPFSPTAELARYHLRNTVVYFLERPPVQGKTALDMILAQIRSEYFPTDSELAFQHFNSGPLVRAKDSLIRNLILVLTKKFLRDKEIDICENRILSALKAIYQMYPRDFETILETKLSGIISSLDDDSWDKVINYLYAIPVAWNFLKACSINAAEYIKITVSVESLQKALYINGLRAETINRLNSIPELMFEDMIRNMPMKELTDRALECFVKSESYAEAEKNFRKKILPLSEFYDKEQVRQIIVAFNENNQIRGCFDMPSLYTYFFSLTEPISKSLESDWRNIYEYFKGKSKGNELKNKLQEEFGYIDKK